MPYKIEPIRIRKSLCILESIAPNLSIVHYAYVLIVLATVFSIAWYKTVSNAVLWYTMEYPTLSLVFSWYMYTERIQVTRVVFHRIQLESVV
jgi:hypothetical protein